MKHLPSGWIRWLKFNAVGGIGILVQLGTLALLRSGLGLNYLLATAIAVEAAVLHNFLWHERFTWRDRPAANPVKRLVSFNLATGAFSIVGNIFFTKLLVDAGIKYLPANAMSIALCSIINFFLNDRLVFVVSADARKACIRLAKPNAALERCFTEKQSKRPGDSSGHCGPSFGHAAVLVALSSDAAHRVHNPPHHRRRTSCRSGRRSNRSRYPRSNITTTG